LVIGPDPASLPNAAPPPVRRGPVGDLKLETAALRAVPGQIVVVTVTGSNLEGYMAGVYDTLEARIDGQWRTVYYLATNAWSGNPPQNYLLNEDVMFPFVGVPLRPYEVKVPYIAPGNYRIRHDIGGPGGSVTLHGELLIQS